MYRWGKSAGGEGWMHLFWENIRPAALVAALCIGWTVADAAEPLDAGKCDPEVASTTEELIDSCRQLAEQYPEETVIQEFLASTLMNAGRTAEGLELWFKLAAAGDPFANYSLGQIYQKGTGVTKSYADAVRYFKLASDGGFGPGHTWLGRMYELGRGVDADPAAARRLYEMALKADPDIPSDAHLFLGRMLLLSADEEEIGEGVRLLKIIADDGWGYAHEALGDFFLAGSAKIPADPKQAAHHLRLAADDGINSAKVSLAKLLFAGKGVGKDDTEAHRLLEEAASSGGPQTLYDVAIIYRNGKLTRPDGRKVIDYLERAAADGFTPAMYPLAFDLEGGVFPGVEDPDESARWMLEAIRNGDDYAMKEMEGNARNWSGQFRRSLQRRLRAEGHYSGEIDGSFGPGTLAALESLAAN